MNVLLLGSGGREHAIAWKLFQSENLKKLYIAPGNPGTAKLGTNLNLNLSDFESLKNAALHYQIDMVIVGPEEPLVHGISDSFSSDTRTKEILVIGPSSQGAMLEGSKDFAKQFMLRHNIPTARFQTFVNGEENNADRFLATLKPPYVIKADGLAAGKGVVILSDIHDASLTVREFFNGKFGEASKKLVIEEFLPGIELSVFVITDGNSFLILPEAKDYKRIGDSDTGPNTGGMGAISPVPFADADFMKKVETRVIIPTIKGLQKENIPYQGFIFFGLMNVAGDPYVIEYNVRMGDPETEAVFPRIESDMLEVFEKTGKKLLHQCKISISQQVASTVILVSKGYPGDYEKGKIITGIDSLKDVIAFQAGTKMDDGNIITSGGRVIALTGMGNSIEDALAKSYKATETIQYEGKYFRKDIGRDLINS